MEFYINSCCECPMFNDIDYRAFCQHPTFEEKPIDLTEDIPEWCPLKEEHLSIHLKQPTV